MSNDLLLRDIQNEIEREFDCEVVSISYAKLLSLCVMVKVKFKEDFIYKPFSELPKPETICFSERTIMFYRRVDLFKSSENYKLN